MLAFLCIFLGVAAILDGRFLTASVLFLASLYV